MKTRPTHPLTPAQREALEARFALRLSARLEEGAQSVSHDIAERLRVGREQALRAARESRVAAPSVAPLAAPVLSPVAAPVAIGVGAGGAASGMGIPGLGGTGAPSAGGLTGNGLGTSQRARTPGRGRRLDDGPTSWGWRLASVLPVIALVAGLWGIQRYAKHEQVEAATDVDMQLLTDDLPPAAYTDPGFEEFLSRDAGPTVRDIEDAPPELGDDLTTTETQAEIREAETAPAADR